MSPPHFPMTPSQLRGSWRFDSARVRARRKLEGLTVLAREIPHKGGRTFGYRVSDGRSTLTYMPDHCPTALGAGPSGCGEYHPAALELAAGPTCWCTTHSCYPGGARSEARFGHAAADYAVELGRRAGASAVVLFHHRPDRTDAALDELAGRLTSRALQRLTFAAQGSVIEL